MKKKLIALLVTLVMILSFGFVLVGCNNTEKVESGISDLQAEIAALKQQLADNKLDLSDLEAALASIQDAITTNADALEALTELEAIVKALQGEAQAAVREKTAQLYEDLVRELRVGAPATSNGRAQGTVHGGYVGEANVVTGANGVVTSVELNEFFLPHTYATNNTSTDRTNSWQGAVSGDDLVNTTSAATAQYARYIQIGNAIFELQTTKTTVSGVEVTHALTAANMYAQGGSGKATASTPVYKQVSRADRDDFGIIGVANGSSNLIADLTSLITRNPKVAAWYVSQVTNSTCGFIILKTATATTAGAMNIGTVAAPKYVAPAQTVTSTTGTLTNITALNYSNSLNKAEGFYWAQGSATLGWLGNFGSGSSLIETMVASNLSLHAYRFAQVGSYWTAGTINTGATATDFVEYYLLAQQAYLNALATANTSSLKRNVTKWAYTATDINNVYSFYGTTAAAMASSVNVQYRLQRLYAASSSNVATRISDFKTAVAVAVAAAAAPAGIPFGGNYVTVEGTGANWALANVTEEAYKVPVKVVFNITNDQIVDIVFTTALAQFTAQSFLDNATKYTADTAKANTFTEVFGALLGTTATAAKAWTKLTADSAGVLFTGNTAVTTGATQTARNIASSVQAAADSYLTPTTGAKVLAQSFLTALTRYNAADVQNSTAINKTPLATALATANATPTADNVNAFITAMNGVADYTNVAKYKKVTKTGTYWATSRVNGASYVVTVTVVFDVTTHKIVDILYTNNSSYFTNTSGYEPSAYSMLQVRQAFIDMQDTAAAAIVTGDVVSTAGAKVQITSGATQTAKNVANAIVAAATQYVSEKV